MTPEEARDLLDGTTPGPWFFDDDMDGRVYTIGPIVPIDVGLSCSTDDAALAAHAPDMAAMIAGMREEYAVSLPDGQLVGAGWGTHDTALEDMNAWRRDGYDARIVRRYVTEPEEA